MKKAQIVSLGVRVDERLFCVIAIGYSAESPREIPHLINR